MTIRNFGLMWEREHVLWGRQGQGNAGRLMGMGPSSEKVGNQTDVDFSEQAGVYVLYRDERVVYVGQAGKGRNALLSRLNNHRFDHLADRWDRFSWFGIRRVNRTTAELAALPNNMNANRKGILNLLEGLLINVIEPPLNKRGADWKDIHQYYQFYEGWSEWSDRELLIGIAEKLGIET